MLNEVEPVFTSVGMGERKAVLFFFFCLCFFFPVYLFSDVQC